MKTKFMGMSESFQAREGQPRCQDCNRKIWWGNGGWNHMKASIFEAMNGPAHEVAPSWPGDVRREVVNVTRPVDC